MDRLGILGAPSDWLISCHVDLEMTKKVLGIELVSLDIKELSDLYNENKDVIYPKGLLHASFDENELDKAYRLYFSIKELVKKHNLKGFTIRCFDLLGTLHTTACLGLSLLNEEGIIASCEGDVPAMISMFLANKLLKKHGFQANPSYILQDSNEFVIAHCTLPLDMCNSYKLDTHFESNTGVAIKGEMQVGPVTVFRVSADLKQYIILEGEIEQNLNQTDLCRTQIKIKLNSPDNVRYFLKNPIGNHHIITYGHNKSVLDKYLKDKGLQAVKY